METGPCEEDDNFCLETFTNGQISSRGCPDEKNFAFKVLKKKCFTQSEFDAKSNEINDEIAKGGRNRKNIRCRSRW